MLRVCTIWNVNVKMLVEVCVFSWTSAHTVFQRKSKRAAHLNEKKVFLRFANGLHVTDFFSFMGLLIKLGNLLKKYQEKWRERFEMCLKTWINQNKNIYICIAKIKYRILFSEILCTLNRVSCMSPRLNVKKKLRADFRQIHTDSFR